MCSYVLFFFNDTATTEIYTLSLHDALPIWPHLRGAHADADLHGRDDAAGHADQRSEEHTSELQSHLNLVCRLLLEKKKSAYASATRSFRAHLHLSAPSPCDQPSRYNKMYSA